MKKLFYTLIIFMMFLTVTNAAKCNVISGTGKSIGDEVACGTEHFYVIENDGKQVKMLSKYNLLAGYTQETVKISKKEYSTTKELYNHKEVKKRLEQGYTIDEYYTDLEEETEEYKTLIFRKQSGKENKTIFFEQKTMTQHEFFNRKDVKELFEQGYYFSKALFENTNCQTDKECTYDFYGAIFVKSIYWESKTFVLDEPIKEENIEEYIKNNEEFKKIDSNEYYIGKICDTNIDTEMVKDTKISNCSVIGYTKINKDLKEKVYQDETAIGAIGDENRNIEPLEVGIHGGFYGNKSSELYLKYFYDFETSYSYEALYPVIITGEYYFDAYYNTLTSEGFNILDINPLTIGEINNITKNVTSKELPIIEWYENSEAIKDSLLIQKIIVLGKLKEVIPEKYSWLWGTTYWLGSISTNDNIFFIDTMGEICTTHYCFAAYGAGIRPVITLSSKDLIYNIKTKTDGNGTIESSHVEAEKGEVVKFTIKPNEGYVLKEVKVTDESGNVIVFKENTFTMPEANVIIEATFEVENSDTSTSNIIVAVILLLISFTIFYKFKNKAKWIE